MDYLFLINDVLNVAKEQSKFSDDLKEITEKVMGLCDNVDSNWQGKDAQEYTKDLRNYKSNMNALSTTVGSFSVALQKIAEIMKAREAERAAKASAVLGATSALGTFASSSLASGAISSAVSGVNGLNNGVSTFESSDFDSNSGNISAGSAPTIDFSKISSNAHDALNGDFISENKVNKEYFEGNLEFIDHGDGTVQIVKDGTVMGYAPDEAIKIPDFTPEQSANTVDTSATLNESNYVKADSPGMSVLKESLDSNDKTLLDFPNTSSSVRTDGPGMGVLKETLNNNTSSKTLSDFPNTTTSSQSSGPTFDKPSPYIDTGNGIDLNRVVEAKADIPAGHISRPGVGVLNDFETFKNQTWKYDQSSGQYNLYNSQGSIINSKDPSYFKDSYIKE